MARTPLARINPALLAWGRTSIGLSLEDAARRVGVPEARLRSWESGESAPTVAQLRKAAHVYRRPLAVFYLPEPPRGFDAMKDFRRLPDSVAEAWSPELHVEFRRATRQREIALELLENAGTELRRVELPAYADDPETFAGAVRELLGVSLEEQMTWRDRYRALAGWIEAVEEAGALVLQTSEVELDEMRGFSLALEPLPVVVVNAQDSPRGRTFTLLHELTHALLRNGGLCDLGERESQSEEGRTEVFCNRVAAAVLMPRAALEAETAVLRHRPGAEWEDDELRSLADKYGASREAVLRRLVTIGKATMAHYLRKREEFLRIYAEQMGPRTGFAPYHRVKVRDLGRSYVRLVLEAYHREEIGASDLADSLGVKLKHVAKIEAEVLGARR
ncbi:MAG: ImmA/IrrE family metallo-endopeptidase [Thermoleophilia bacterium]|nr:ImmA/IrrE family metallo-endopeptidase [Thermoleophilia bacterium]